MTTADEHLARCKATALALVDGGDLVSAVTAMWSDLQKHPETKNRVAFLLQLGMVHANAYDEAGVRRWINGFN